MTKAKRIKVGGMLYSGYVLKVGANPGEYTLYIPERAQSLVNSIIIIPDTHGIGDFFKVNHIDKEKNIKNVIAENIYNVGAFVAWNFDLASLVPMDTGEAIEVIYSNIAGFGMNVYVTIEKLY